MKLLWKWLKRKFLEWIIMIIDDLWDDFESAENMMALKQLISQVRKYVLKPTEKKI